MSLLGRNHDNLFLARPNTPTQTVARERLLARPNTPTQTVARERLLAAQHTRMQLSVPLADARPSRARRVPRGFAQSGFVLSRREVAEPGDDEDDGDPCYEAASGPRRMRESSPPADALETPESAVRAYRQQAYRRFKDKPRACTGRVRYEARRLAALRRRRGGNGRWKKASSDTVTSPDGQVVKRGRGRPRLRPPSPPPPIDSRVPRESGVPPGQHPGPASGAQPVLVPVCAAPSPRAAPKCPALPGALSASCDPTASHSPSTRGAEHAPHAVFDWDLACFDSLDAAQWGDTFFRDVQVNRRM